MDDGCRSLSSLSGCSFAGSADVMVRPFQPVEPAGQPGTAIRSRPGSDALDVHGLPKALGLAIRQRQAEACIPHEAYPGSDLMPRICPSRDLHLFLDSMKAFLAALQARLDTSMGATMGT